MSFTAKLINVGGFTVFIGNEQYSTTTQHPKYTQLIECIKNNNTEEFLKLFKFDPMVAVNTNGFSMRNDKVYWNGEELHNSIASRILEMVKEGFDTSNMVKFLENLMENPSRSSIVELYDFLSNSNLPITEDGCFLAYKSVVRSTNNFTDKNNREVKVDDLVDKYTRTLRNNVGDILSMARNQVDDDRRRNCSYGYHAGGLQYVTQSYVGDQVVIVKINPKDVVSVPLDYNCQKLRTTCYEVVGLYAGALNRQVWTSDSYDPIDEEEYEYEIDTSELVANDTIGFLYENDMRYGTVLSCGTNTILILLSENDPSYIEGDINIRSFSQSQMTCVTLL